MLTVYLDESISKDTAEYVVAGWMAPAHEWASLQTQWKLRMEKAGVPLFHAVDCWHMRGDFDSWTTERRDQLWKDLIEIVVKHEVHGWSAGIIPADFDAVFPHLSADLRDRYYYGMCLIQAIDKFSEFAFDVALGHRIAFVYEKRQKIAGAVQEVFDAAQKAPVFRNRDALATITGLLKADPEGYPLQVADLLAWESCRHLSRTRKDPHVPTRKSFQVLSQRLFAVPEYLGVDVLRPFAEMVNEYFQDSL